jgi:hypothetical protein
MPPHGMIFLADRLTSDRFSAFEIRLKSQLPTVPALAKLNHKVIQG